MGVVGDFGEVSAACMTWGNVLNTIRAADRVEGTGRAGAVSIAKGQRPVEGQRVRNTGSELLPELIIQTCVMFKMFTGISCVMWEIWPVSGH